MRNVIGKDIATAALAAALCIGGLENEAQAFPPLGAPIHPSQIERSQKKNIKSTMTSEEQTRYEETAGKILNYMIGVPILATLGLYAWCIATWPKRY